MRQWSVVLFALLLGLAAAVPCGAELTVVVGRGEAPCVQMAAADLVRCLYGISGELPALRRDQPRPAAAGVITLHSTSSSPSAEGYTVRSDGHTARLEGDGPVGTAHAVYSFLEACGCGFTFGGDSLPAPGRVHLPRVTLRGQPVFAVRGSLPWYNFFDSPTAWDYEDYCSFFDQMAKMKLNFIGFHSYDSEPFCAFRDAEGRLVYGDPLQSTAQPTWGAVPMRTGEFGFGTAEFFPGEYFGARVATDYRTREQGIVRAQALLARALSYARNRGLRTCVGFEVNGDPTVWETEDLLERRLTATLEAYPMLNYVWIWESEAMGRSGYPCQPLRSELGAYYRRFEEAFSYIPEPERRTEAVRLAVYAQKAHQILQSVAPGVRLVLSGWGGDHHLLMSDFYTGLHRVLPRDIIFAALDDIAVGPQVSQHYADCTGREVWPIPWFEYDGDQWGAQPNTAAFAGACRDALAKGATGLLGIHWRTRGVEESAAYAAQFAWEPDLTVERFYGRVAERWYGPALAAPMSAVLQRLQALGYRWVGGGGQAECGTFGWGPGRDPAKLEAVRSIRAEVAPLRAGLDAPTAPPPAQGAAERLDHLLAELDWALAFEATADRFAPGGTVAEAAARARTATDEAARRAAAQEALRAARDCPLGEGMLRFASVMSSRGELGTLATVNAKAFAACRDVVREMSALAGLAAPDLTAALPAQGTVPEIVVPRRNTLLAGGARLTVEAIIRGEGIEAELHCRTFGATDWQCLPLGRLSPSVFRVTVPRSLTRRPGLEWHIEARDAAGQRACWPSDYQVSPQRVAITPGSLKSDWPNPVRLVTSAPDPPLMPSALAVPGVGVQLGWQPSPSRVRRYLVFRAKGAAVTATPEQLLAATTDTWWEDRTALPGQTYAYCVVGQASGGKTGEPGGCLRVTMPPAQPPAAPTGLEAKPALRRIALTWPPAGPTVVGYRVYRAPAAEGPYERLTAEPLAADNYRPQRFTYHTTEGVAHHFHLTALDAAGQESPPSDSVSATPLPGEPAPVLSLDFEGSAQDAASGRPGQWQGAALFAPSPWGEAAQFDGTNGLYVPDAPELNPPDEISVDLRFSAAATDGMPLLLCHGAWRTDGYFVQILGQRLRWHIAGVGDCDGGAIAPSQWYHALCTYDGREMTTFLDGQAVASLAAQGPIRPAARNLWIGRYEAPDAVYHLRGLVDRVRVYPIALSPEEVEE